MSCGMCPLDEIDEAIERLITQVHTLGDSETRPEVLARMVDVLELLSLARSRWAGASEVAHRFRLHQIAVTYKEWGKDR